MQRVWKSNVGLMVISAVLLSFSITSVAEAQDRSAGPVFAENGNLIKPADLDQWVFLGSSLGMGYSEGSFDPDNPGLFQIVTMEPGAYAYFSEHGEYADGTMFALQFYEPQKNLSTNRNGFVMGGLRNYEIHILDKQSFAEDGRAFYLFQRDDASASMVPPGNACVTCHMQDGAYDGTFAQFYPSIRNRIPAGALAETLARGTEIPE